MQELIAFFFYMFLLIMIMHMVLKHIKHDCTKERELCSVNKPPNREKEIFHRTTAYINTVATSTGKSCTEFIFFNNENLLVPSNFKSPIKRGVKSVNVQTITFSAMNSEEKFNKQFNSDTFSRLAKKFPLGELTLYMENRIPSLQIPFFYFTLCPEIIIEHLEIKEFTQFAVKLDLRVYSNGEVSSELENLNIKFLNCIMRVTENIYE